MRVNITKGFKIALQGIHVIEVEPGEQELDNEAAEWAIENEHGQASKGKAAGKSGPNLEKLSVKKLKALAKERGVEIDANETKADLIAKITVANSAAAAVPDAWDHDAGNE